MKFKKILVTILAVMMCFTTLNNRLFADDEVPAEAISLNDYFIDLAIGDNYQIVATLVPDNSTDTISYAIGSGSEYITVSDTGLISGLAEGYAEVVISAGEIEERMGVNVYDNTIKRYNVEHYVNCNGETPIVGLNWNLEVGDLVPFREQYERKATKIEVNGVAITGDGYFITGDEPGETIIVTYYLPYLGNGYSVSGADEYIKGGEENYILTPEDMGFSYITVDGTVLDSYDWNDKSIYAYSYYMNSLASGNHTFRIVYVDGYAEKVVNVIDRADLEWEEPTYKWADDYSSATATRKCITYPSLVETETVKSIVTVLREPTCAEVGVSRYNAIFTNPAFEAQAVQIEVAKVPHTYDEVLDWSWNMDADPFPVATVFVKCSVCGDEYNESAEATCIAADYYCDKEGEVVWEVTIPIGENIFKDTYSYAVPARGHAYSAEFTWAEDYSSATAVITCQYDESHHSDVLTANIERQVMDATCSAPGATLYFATVQYDGNDYTDVVEVEIPQLEHVYSFEEIVWDGWTAKAVYVCDNCDEKAEVECELETLTDVPASCKAAGQKEVKAIVSAEKSLDGVEHTDVKSEDIPQLDHVAGEAVKENVVAATCEEDGSYDEVVYCTLCNDELSREHKTEKALGHDWDEWIVDVEATCLKDGARHRVCKHNEDHIENEVIKALGHQAGEPVKENEVAATCEEAGSYDLVTYCVRCNEELNREHVVVEALGHDYSTTYVWNEELTKCTAMRVCANNPEHNITETVGTSYRVVKPSTCVDHGKAVHVAIFKNELFSIQIKEVELPLAEHKYVFDHMEWAEDNTSAEAIYKCSVCEDVVKVVAEVSSEITKEATCEERGLRVITALVKAENSIDGFEHKDTKEEELAKLMHVWQLKEWQWADDYSSAKAVFECVVNPETTMSTDARVTVEEDDKKFAYKAVAIVDGKEYFDTKSVEKPFEYKFLDAPIKEYVLKSNKDVVWHTNGELDKLVAIKVDDKGLVVDKDVILSEGSTIAKVVKEYMEALKEGKHTIKFVYDDGELESEFVVKLPATGDDSGNKDDVPTGDAGNLAFWYTTLSTSLAGAYLALRKKKED